MYPSIQYETTLGSDGAGIVEMVAEGVSTDWVNESIIINPNINWGDSEVAQASDYHLSYES